LALRAFYGHPRYVFPPREELLEKVRAFVDKALADGKTPVLIAAAVGAAQELVRFLGDRGHTLRLHATAHHACEVYQRNGIALKGFVTWADEGEVALVPSTVRLDRLNLGPMRTCRVSG